MSPEIGTKQLWPEQAVPEKFYTHQITVGEGSRKVRNMMCRWARYSETCHKHVTLAI